MNNKFLILLCAIYLSAFAKNGSANDLALEKLWELDGLSNPESVIYDAKTDYIYVSNINGTPVDKDNNGFISKVSLQREIITLQWATGLNAPKGLAIYGEYLYVADIDELVEIALASGKVNRRFAIADAKFFNDAVAAEDGTIYVADSATNTIHQLHDSQFTIWLKSSELNGPNGLYIEPDRMLVTAWGSDEEPIIPGQVLAVSMQDKSVSVIGNNKTEGNLDGIERSTPGEYFITEWTIGNLLLLKNSGEAINLLSLEKGMADLDFIEDKQILLIPMLLSNKLLAYKVN